MTSGNAIGLTFIEAVKRYVSPTLREILPDKGADVMAGKVEITGIAVPIINIDTLIVLFQNEIGDTRNGVRAVKSRSASGEDFDTLDKAGRDRADIDGRRARDGRDVVPPVDQNKPALGSKAAQIESVDTGISSQIARLLGVGMLRGAVRLAGDEGVRLRLSSDAGQRRSDDQGWRGQRRDRSVDAKAVGTPAWSLGTSEGSGSDADLKNSDQERRSAPEAIGCRRIRPKPGNGPKSVRSLS